MKTIWQSAEILPQPLWIFQTINIELYTKRINAQYTKGDAKHTAAYIFIYQSLPGKHCPCNIWVIFTWKFTCKIKSFHFYNPLIIFLFFLSAIKKKKINWNYYFKILAFLGTPFRWSLIMYFPQGLYIGSPALFCG